MEIGSVVLEQHIFFKKNSLRVPGFCFFKVYFDYLCLCACKCVFVREYGWEIAMTLEARRRCQLELQHLAGMLGTELPERAV